MSVEQYIGRSQSIEGFEVIGKYGIYAYNTSIEPFVGG
jgi:hypothetical protein